MRSIRKEQMIDGVMYRRDFTGLLCSNPSCPIDHGESDGLYMHQRCHMKAGVLATVKDHILDCRCAVCKSKVLRVFVDTKEAYLVPSCHLSPVFVFYKAGTISILCKKCDTEVVSLDVSIQPKDTDKAT